MECESLSYPCQLTFSLVFVFFFCSFLENSAYTVPLLVGSSQQNLSLQVDTGSSDLVSRAFVGHVAFLISDLSGSHQNLVLLLHVPLLVDTSTIQAPRRPPALILT